MSSLIPKEKLILYFQDPLLLPREPPSSMRMGTRKTLHSYPIRNFPWRAELLGSKNVLRTFLWLNSKYLLFGDLSWSDAVLLVSLAQGNQILSDIALSSKTLIEILGPKGLGTKKKAHDLREICNRIYKGYHPQVVVQKSFLFLKKPAEPRIIGVGYRDKGSLPENTLSWKEVGSHFGIEEGIPCRRLSFLQWYLMNIHLLSGSSPKGLNLLPLMRAG